MPRGKHTNNHARVRHQQNIQWNRRASHGKSTKEVRRDYEDGKYQSDQSAQAKQNTAPGKTEDELLLLFNAGGTFAPALAISQASSSSSTVLRRENWLDVCIENDPTLIHIKDQGFDIIHQCTDSSDLSHILFIITKQSQTTTIAVCLEPLRLSQGFEDYQESVHSKIKNQFACSASSLIDVGIESIEPEPTRSAPRNRRN